MTQRRGLRCSDGALTCSVQSSMSTGLGVQAPHSVGITKHTAVMRQVTDSTSISLVNGVHTVCLQRPTGKSEGGKENKNKMSSHSVPHTKRFVSTFIIPVKYK